ncbi:MULTISPECIES: SMP-30/gluconolactonase/LRE family protein [Maribacter]|uniref:SMP-30/gluconolactonase/LRE family protein n=1 Tax=Maribacter flavus TaxID=1658664 RepID=A0ABU7IL66_9FLAO|nr:MULTISPECIES: SMP-30/gluconolactonase/LRE family protein [Maribacter]MDC6406532.1 SMP-30/gluconolactonase/LRE family protein [Maribacter sp. PR66]MEE1973650.1 SMP-30/gluconolactonase/LRE family protein [Maribacter flavus]
MKTINVLFALLLLNSCAYAQDIVEAGASLTLVSEEFKFTEGPARDAEGNVYFTDQPNDRIVKWDAETNTVSDWMHPSGRSNGLYFDHQGNLISCADENNQLWNIDPEKNVTVLVEKFEGKFLGGPNDVWVDPKGGMYITDPLYKRDWWKDREPEVEKRRVYYLAPGSTQLTIVEEDLVMPNGIIGSKNGKKLFIADPGDKKTYVYKINKDGSLSDRELFCEMGSDGMTLDNKGNLYLTGNGVTVFNKDGKQIKHIKVPENWTANVTFGGPERDILFITAMDAVYILQMKVKGIN